MHIGPLRRENATEASAATASEAGPNVTGKATLPHRLATTSGRFNGSRPTGPRRSVATAGQPDGTRPG